MILVVYLNYDFFFLISLDDIVMYSVVGNENVIILRYVSCFIGFILLRCL